MAKTKTRERPIVMSGDEVRAILDGRKTQTRRPVKININARDAFGRVCGKMVFDLSRAWEDFGFYDKSREQYLHVQYAHPDDAHSEDGWATWRIYCPFGVPGDRLWVRERYCILDRDGWIDPSKPRYELFATNPYPRRNAVAYGDFAHDPDSERCRKELGYKWRPSIHMPRWASRLTLAITDIRLQRVQEISWHEIRNEGVDCPAHDFPGGFCCSECPSLRKAFAVLWDRIYGPGAWDRNDWCWIVTFSVVKGTKERT